MTTKYLIFIREFFLKYIFGKIVMLNYYQTYYVCPFFIPYIFSFILECFNINYVYTYDKFYNYQDYKNNVILLPPILNFKIDNKDLLDILKDYKSNIPIVFILDINNIINPKLTEITYFNNGVMKKKDIKNIEKYDSLKDIFD